MKIVVNGKEFHIEGITKINPKRLCIMAGMPEDSIVEGDLKVTEGAVYAVKNR
jgi:hypothetical protein